MKIPDISIIQHGVWHNSKRHSKTSARFVLTYEVEFNRKSYTGSNINDVLYPVAENTIIFCRSGDIRYSRYDNGTTVENEFIYFILAAEKNSAFEEMLNNIPHCFHADEQLLTLWNDLFHSSDWNGGLLFEMAVHLKLLLFLNVLSQKGKESADRVEHSARQQAMFEAIRFMTEHLTDNLSVSEIAEHIGYSQSRFNSIFKSLTGRTPHAYYLSLKITESKYMLLNTDKSIADIAEMLGFSKASKFGDVFKKECHMTPGQFRKEREALFYDG